MLPDSLTDANVGLVSLLGRDTFGRKKVSLLTASIECQQRPQSWLCSRQFHLGLAAAGYQPYRSRQFALILNAIQHNCPDRNIRRSVSAFLHLFQTKMAEGICAENDSEQS